MRQSIALAAILLLASPTARAEPDDFPETWVEPKLTDCFDEGTLVTIDPEAWDDNSQDNSGLDGDGLRGVGGSFETEDPSTDSIFGSISDAIGHTDPGGTVFVAARGVYRFTSSLSITDDLTVHGFADANVVLSGEDCFEGMADSAATALTIDIGNGETVVLENLDFRHYSTAIELTSVSGATLIVRNCRFTDNATGIRSSSSSTGGSVLVDGCNFTDNTQAIQDDDGGGPEIHVSNSAFTGGSYGIRGPNGLSVTNSTFTGQSSQAIEAAAAKDWRIASSRFSGCGDVCLSSDGAGTGTHEISVSDTRIESAGSHGLLVDGVTVKLTMHDSTSTGNAGDGVHVEAQVGSVITITGSNLEQNDDDGLFVQNTMGCTGPSNLVSVAVMDSRLSVNGDDGIDIGGTGTGCSGNVAGPVECGIVKNTIVGNGGHGIVETTSSSIYHCGVGANMISYNVAGAESGTGAGACTAGSVSLNQVD